MQLINGIILESLSYCTLTVSNTCFDGGYTWYYQSRTTVTRVIQIQVKRVTKVVVKAVRKVKMLLKQV